MNRNGKKVICYNCREDGHVARQCKEKKQEKDLQYFEDKVLLMKAKERGEVLDAEAEAFLADVECDEPYDEPLAITTTTAFNVDHENAYDSDVDEDPHADAAFIANLTSAEGTSGTSLEVINEVHTYDHNLDDNNAPDDNNDPDDNCRPYGTSFNDLVLMADVTPTLVDEVVPLVEETTVLSPQETPNESPSEFEALLGLQAELHAYVLANKEQLLEISNLNAELARCKLEIKDL
nr:hypothetical protein [Tanacetum cinerariifolium]